MNEKNGHIVAMGGGGFAMEPDNPLLDDFVLGLAGNSPARVCFIPTASAESPISLVKFYRAFSGRAIATDLTIFDSRALPRCPPQTSDLAGFINEQDVLYVGGGNTANMLATWKIHGLDRILEQAWHNGKVLCGISAGMICWFRDGITDSFGGLDSLGDGLGLINASACPHYDGEPGRRAAFHKAIARGMIDGYAADDGAALHFCGTGLVEAVASRKEASAYRVERQNGAVQESRLETRFLGSR